MGDLAAIGPTTVRDDTAERHRRKYESANPLQRLTLGRFHDALAATLVEAKPCDILDFGCGEGFLAEALAARSAPLSNYLGVDIRRDAIEDAKARMPGLAFEAADIFSFPGDGRRFDLVLASQVFEHLIEPEKFLTRLAALCDRRLILTVPLEPWFQLMNLARGRDVIRLGNHPEHVNHWNAETFADFVSAHAQVIRVKTVFPFVILEAEPLR